MIEPPYFFLLLWVPLLLAVLIPLVVIPRVRMERRAKVLLAQMPAHERKTVYLAFVSGWYRGKGREMAAMIADEGKAGWTFLKVGEASPLKTIRSWGGGVNLHFIRRA